MLLGRWAVLRTGSCCSGVGRYCVLGLFLGRCAVLCAGSVTWAMGGAVCGVCYLGVGRYCVRGHVVRGHVALAVDGAACGVCYLGDGQCCVRGHVASAVGGTACMRVMLLRRWAVLRAGSCSSAVDGAPCGVIVRSNSALLWSYFWILGTIHQNSAKNVSYYRKKGGFHLETTLFQ